MAGAIERFRRFASRSARVPFVNRALTTLGRQAVTSLSLSGDNELKMMRPAQGISFPRSGHGVVYHAARLYFGEIRFALFYCDANDPEHCGCGSVPCANPKRKFAKNHDFGLRTSPGLPIIPTERYLIQYRSPIQSIASNFKLHLRNHPEDNSRSGWEKFAFQQIAFWNRFIDKWVLEFPNDANPPLYCTYEALLSNPRERIIEILNFLSDRPVDENRVNKILERRVIAPRNSISDFEFYDMGLFNELEDAASHRLAELDLPRFADTR